MSAFENILTSIRALLILLFLCCAVYVPGISTIPPIDRDEARYMQASKQMMETGDLIDIRFQDAARHKKPVGIYWLHVASVSLFGDSITDVTWYRAVSVVGAILAVLMTFNFGAQWIGVPAAFIAATTLAVTIGLTFESHIAKTDSMLLATIVAMQGALGRAYLSRFTSLQRDSEGIAEVSAGRCTVATFWIALGFGILIKGPVSIMVAITTIFALTIFDRSFRLVRALRPWPHAIWAVTIVAPWFLAITLATEGTFFAEFFAHDFMRKIISGQEGHGAPIGYHSLFMFVYFFPGFLFLVPSLRTVWSGRSGPIIKFLVAWFLPSWLLIEFMATKLPNYALPMYPALALIVGLGAWEVMNKTQEFSKLSRVFTAGLWMLVSTILPIAAIVMLYFWGDGVNWWSIILAIVILIGAAAVSRDLIRQEYARAWAGSIMVAALSTFLVLGVTLPSLDKLFLSRALEQAVQERTALESTKIVLAGFHEPSAIFLLGTGTILTDGVGAANELANSSSTIAAVEVKELANFIAEADDLELKWFEVERVSGFNYSRGDQLELVVITGMEQAQIQIKKAVVEPLANFSQSGEQI